MAFPLIPVIMALAQFVPAITRWVSGENAGPIAETIAGVAQTVTGSTSIQDAIQRIMTEPDKQRAFQLAMQEKGDELEKAYLLDRQSARERDARIQVATGRNRRGDILAGIAITGFIALMALLFLGPEISSGERDLVMIMTGALISIVKDVYGFEFGSSKDAARGAQAMADYIKSNGKQT
jgi:hypothetical protein